MLTESSLKDLYDSTLLGFPHSQRRQHSVDTIRVVDLDWIPFLGVRTLFLKAAVENFQGGGKEYKPIMVFKEVQYFPEPTGQTISIIASDNKTYHLLPLLWEEHDVLVRCQCKDFFYRFNFYDSLTTPTSLYGRVRKKYHPIPGSNRPPANPQQREGVCKHILSMSKALRDARVLQ